MSLPYVILGLLQQQERTGYDLKNECFDDCIAHLWPADQAQIYRTLDKLETQGWIVCTVEIQYDRPNRKVYRITEAGQAEFHQWLQTHHPLPIVREPLLVQLYFAESLSNQMIVHLLQQELEAQQQKLGQREAVDVPALETVAPSREQTVQQLILSLMQRREQTYLDWLREAIEVIQHQPESSSPPPRL